MPDMRLVDLRHPSRIAAVWRASRSTCRNCGESILSIDGWLHENGSSLCPVQPPPLTAEPDDGGCA